MLYTISLLGVRGKTDSSGDTLHLQVCASNSLSCLLTLHIHIKALCSQSSFKGILKLIFKKGQMAVFSDYSRSDTAMMSSSSLLKAGCDRDKRRETVKESAQPGEESC